MNSDQSPLQRDSEKLEYEAIGPYKVLGLLGQGGMGTVYRGVHAKTGDTVAVKVISAAMAQHQRFRRRFDAEIQTLVKLKHPGIVQLIGFGEEKGLLFYSMEYVDGENLQQVLRRTKRLPWERVLDIGIEVCSALKHAHDFGVIHRDLKPANLMINSQGAVKLTDFGIAKLFGSADATVEGSVLGTADFMAPEQAEGNAVTVRSDLYSLGSVCYAALTGRAPFQGKSIPEVLFNVRYGTYPSLVSLVPETPAELATLIDELLARDVSKRPPTALVVGNRFQVLKVGLKKHPPKPISEKIQDVGKLKELTSIEIDDSPSLLMDLMTRSDGVGKRNPVDEKTLESQNPPGKRTSSSQGNGSPVRDTQATSLANAPAGPHENTLPQSQERREFDSSHSLDRPSGIDFIGNTTFTEVNDDVRTRSASTFQTVEEPTSVAQWIAVGVLGVALVGCVALLVFLLQGPSANQLYAEIQSAIDSGDDEAWLNVEDTATRFKELFPDDERVVDADSVIREAEWVRAVRQLQRKARRGGDELGAIEQAYLECINAQNLSVEEAIRKLDAFLVMYGNDEQASEMQKLYVAQAKRSLEEIHASQKTTKNQAYKSLLEQMNWAEANLGKSAKERWMQALVELFSDKVWARELVEKARLGIQAEPSKSSSE